MATRKKKFIVPKTLGGCADKLYDVRAEKAQVKKVLAELDEQEKILKNHIIDELPKSQAEGITGRKAKVTINTKKIGSVKDWDMLYKYILRHKHFSLLQRRLSDSAVQERWEDKKKIPGVEPFTVVKVSCTKK